MDTSEVLERLREERDGVALYRALADVEGDPRLAEVYRRMADAEGRHAQLWAEKLRAAGIAVPEHRVSWRTRILALIARRFGTQSVLPTVVSMEDTGSREYGAMNTPEAPGVARDERSHARLLRTITTSLPGGFEGGLLGRLEGRHRLAGGNALRAAILGANDGLVSNLSLVMGVAGAAMAPSAIVVTGLSGMVAGSASMALGEWLSVQSSRELYADQIRAEKAELEMAPHEEAEELALIYEAKGLPASQARALAHGIMGDPSRALDTLAREELGIDPDSLGGSPWGAALASFVLFAAGAFVPVAPFLFIAGPVAVAASLVASTAALFALGAGATLFTRRHAVKAGARQVGFGLVAAALTWGVGRLIGADLRAR